jgi:murein DD-endopeptidase MepM/ murein hydrolase activator NlpD
MPPAICMRLRTAKSWRSRTVWSSPAPISFYDVVMAIEVKHASGIVVRYGEISGVPAGVKVGTIVKAGDVIAYVGRMQSVSQAMLHFELFSGQATGPPHGCEPRSL